MIQLYKLTLQVENIHRIEFSDLAQIGQVHGQWSWSISLRDSKKI